MTNLKGKIILNIFVILVVTVLLASASTPVVKVEEAKGSPGSTVSLNVTLSEAPNGLSGYNITVSPENPKAVQIISVEFPEWASLHNNSSLPSDSIWLTAIDLNGKVQKGALNIILATLSVRMDVNESTVFSAAVERMDDDNGSKISFDPVPDKTVNVESSSSGGGGGGGVASGENYSNIEVNEKYDMHIYKPTFKR